MADYQLRELERRWREAPGNESVRQEYAHHLGRLIDAGASQFLPQYVATGEFWIENLTNNAAVLNAEGLPAERDVPVFRFYNVSSRGGLLEVTVRDLLEGRAEYRTQDDWVERTRRRDFGRWVLPDAVEFTDVLGELLVYDSQFKGQSALKSQALKFFEGRLTGDSWPMTSTCVMYNSQAPDEVIHRYGYDGQLPVVLASIMGQAQDIEEDAGLDEPLAAIVGRSARETKHIYTAVTGCPPRLWRASSRPRGGSTARAVVLGRSVGDGRFNINVSNIVGGRALGWSAQNFFP